MYVDNDQIRGTNPTKIPNHLSNKLFPVDRYNFSTIYQCAIFLVQRSFHTKQFSVLVSKFPSVKTDISCIKISHCSTREKPWMNNNFMFRCQWIPFSIAYATVSWMFNIRVIPRPASAGGRDQVSLTELATDTTRNQPGGAVISYTVI